MLLPPLLLIVIFTVGVLVGGIGIGGVLLVPALKYLGGIPLYEAIPACMLSYIATGTMATFIYARHGTINWPLAIKLCAGGLPGAYLGAILLPYTSAAILEYCIVVLLLASGMYALLRNTMQAESEQAESGTQTRSGTLIAIGFFTGVGSALTGTGGPILLIPMLIWFKLPMLLTIGLAQVIQLPVSIMATAGNFAQGQVNIQLSLWLAVVLVGGVVLGAKLAHMLPVSFLNKLMAVLLMITGLSILTELLFRLSA